MLALKSKVSLTLLLAGMFCLSPISLVGQQTPAQRYQPVRDHQVQQAPPSVHVPPSQTRPLNRAGSATTSFNFSDASQAGNATGRTYYPEQRRPAQAHYQTPGNQARPAVQQTSYVQETPQSPAAPGAKSPMAGSGPVVPEILGGSMLPVPPASTMNAALNLGTPQASTIEEPRKSPADFAAAMDQVRMKGPRVAPDELAAQQTFTEKMEQLRRQADADAAAKVEAAKRASEQAAAEVQARRTAEAQAAEQAARQADLAKQQEAAQIEAAQIEAERQAAQQAAAQRVAREKAAAEQAAAQAPTESALDFISGNRSPQPAARVGQASTVQYQQTAQEQTAGSSAAQRLVAQQTGQAQAMPAVLALTEASEVGKGQQRVDRQVVPVSRQYEEEVEGGSNTKAAIRLGAPALQVETFGPESIGVNKPANYQVVVRNTSTSTAEQILVGINLPQWVDIENVNMTAGGKELTDGQNQARLVWSIDRIAGNSAQSITITAIPTKAEMFDVGVEWTLVPRKGKANITVTEPRLEMSISGPKELLYGETASYEVVVRNPGTGTAENVHVMLPEELGGARDLLGDIEAGKEKSFQVDLLARTAGDLKLVTTAVADGSLKVIADKELVVRRANLQVSLKGPGLKYAGSIGDYTVTVTNTGDALASDVVTAVALPAGVKYLGGIDSVKLIEGGVRWPIGAIEPGQTRDFKLHCQLDTSGDLQLEVGARGKGDLAASSACLTTVETVADLVLTVADPKGPLPTGEKVPYTIKVVNRGTKAAMGVELVMQFSEGIEPIEVAGHKSEIMTGQGQVVFDPITQLEPGQELSFKVTAEALKSGTHIFRAQLTCQDSDAREIAEGTTRFFGEVVQRTAATPAAQNQGFGGFNQSGSDNLKR